MAGRQDRLDCSLADGRSCIRLIRAVPPARLHLRRFAYLPAAETARIPVVELLGMIRFTSLFTFSVGE